MPGTVKIGCDFAMMYDPMSINRDLPGSAGVPPALPGPPPGAGYGLCDPSLRRSARGTRPISGHQLASQVHRSEITPLVVMPFALG